MSGDLLAIEVEGTVDGKSVVDEKEGWYHLAPDEPVGVPGFAEKLEGTEKGEQRLSGPVDDDDLAEQRFIRQAGGDNPLHFAEVLVHKSGMVRQKKEGCVDFFNKRDDLRFEKTGSCSVVVLDPLDQTEAVASDR